MSSCIGFKQDIQGRLKRAADANTLPLARQELTAAVDAIHEWELCTKSDVHYRKSVTNHDCYTNIFYRLPADDVLFWRQNLEAALADLETVPEDADHLTVSNTLMKLRETILDEGESTSVTVPGGISIYPHNVLYFWLFVGSVLFFCLGGFLLMVVYDR